MKKEMGFDEFLKHSATLLGLQWRPFKRRGIKRKVDRRMAVMGHPDYEAYLERVKTDPEEKAYLSKILTITISRFFRDREVFDLLETTLLPPILQSRKEGELKVWSIACARGEEPYSLSLLWKERFEKKWPGIRISILATDLNEDLLVRAKEGKYRYSSLREVGKDWIQRYFRKEGDFYILDQEVKEGVRLIKHDLLNDAPFFGMDIAFCRNLAFTYFLKAIQVEVLKKVAFSLNDGGYLIIGKKESLPLTYPTLFVSVLMGEGIFQKFKLKDSTL